MATKPVPVRLDLSTIARLDRAAKRLGTNRSALIKFCAQTFVADFGAGWGNRDFAAELAANFTSPQSGKPGGRSKGAAESRSENSPLGRSWPRKHSPKW